MKHIKLSIYLLCSLLINTSFAQLPDTDIFIADLKKENGNWTISNTRNITERKGYDNQPSFLKSESKVLYVSVEDDKQSDVFAFDVESGKKEQITFTTESEYSPAMSPDGKHLSVVRVDADSSQWLYLLDRNNTVSAKKISNSDSTGYYCWINDSSIATFVVGKPHRLQLLDLKNGRQIYIMQNPGRCMKLSPDKSQLYYVDKNDSMYWSLKSLDLSRLISETLFHMPDKTEDFEVLPDNSILAGVAGRLIRRTFDESDEWRIIADLREHTGEFYRISLDAKAGLIAFVAFRGEKP
ncbi:MAG: hypothetical protein DWQ44_03020 [Bacteroidetes bacterium]|nr:MAG: hypothetical protein DWQ44_03020 [Bacteroidota bacterium]